MLSLTVCLKHGLLPSCFLAITLLVLSGIDLVSFQPIVITVPFRQSKSNGNQRVYLDTQTDKVNQRVYLDTENDKITANDGHSLGKDIQSGTLSMETKSSDAVSSTWNISSSQDQGQIIQGQEKTVIIGIGTGRSGTLSVAKFFDQQRDSAVTHEWQQCKGLWWYEASFSNAKARYESYIQRKGTFVGDVALWNLPYVEYFLEFPNVKVVALKRVKNDTLKSFEKWFGALKHFPWITDAQRKFTSYRDNKIYDNCYPNYQFPSRNPSIAEGASIYWDDYYSQVEKLKEKYPDRIIIIDTYEVMDNDVIKADVLTWLGMDPPFKLEIPVTHPTRSKDEIEAVKLTS